MKNGYSQTRVPLLFGIFFLLGGIICLFTGANDYHGDGNMLYEKEVVSDVVSVWMDNTEKEYAPVGRSKSKTVYCTEEHVEIDGKVIIINGRYEEDPGEHINHTLVSFDGKTYRLHDRKDRNTIPNFIAGASFVLIGTMLMAFGSKLKF